jgi:hypothetical protein
MCAVGKYGAFERYASRRDADVFSGGYCAAKYSGDGLIAHSYGAFFKSVEFAIALLRVENHRAFHCC